MPGVAAIVPSQRCLIAAALLSLAATLPAAAGEPWFIDVAGQLGLRFQHQDGRSGEKFYIETAASGGGFLDYDADGDLDIYLLNGAKTPGSPLAAEPRSALFENRDGRFVDVTDAAGVANLRFGMGLCAGDFDGDGRLDFLVTNYGPDRLYRNLGGGRFADVAPQAGVDDPRWSASCAFGDLDGDGDLDLYVTHYVDFRFDHNPFCGDRARNLRAYCRPEAFDGVTDSLYINRGDGTFREEGQSRGLAAGKSEKGFGVVMSDLDGDGDLDLYVANDGTMNRLYVNDGKGRFSDHSLYSGAGYSANGLAQSGMGVDAGDADGDGLLDLLVTNYSTEPNTLYRNLGGLLFEDESARRGLVEPSFNDVGWGVRLADLDNDGDLDLAVANGHAVDNIEIFEAGLSYRQQNRLLLNDGTGRFRDATGEAGPAFADKQVSRGLATGDLDDDGRLDLLITNTNGTPALLLNHLGQGHWLGLDLRGKARNRQAIGARVTLKAGGKTQVREVRSGASFLSQSDLRLHFGLGNHNGPVSLEIRWPDGHLQRETTSSLDRYWTIEYR